MSPVNTSVPRIRNDVTYRLPKTTRLISRPRTNPQRPTVEHGDTATTDHDDRRPRNETSPEANSTMARRSSAPGYTLGGPGNRHRGGGGPPRKNILLLTGRSAVMFGVYVYVRALRAVNLGMSHNAMESLVEGPGMNSGGSLSFRRRKKHARERHGLKGMVHEEGHGDGIDGRVDSDRDGRVDEDTPSDLLNERDKSNWAFEAIRKDRERDLDLSEEEADFLGVLEGEERLSDADAQTKKPGPPPTPPRGVESDPHAYVERMDRTHGERRK